ncbi:vertnin [Rhinoraja longicauda]
MPERSELVEALRFKLQEATECAEAETLRAVTAEVDKQLSVLPVPLLARRTSYGEAEVDPEAKALYPEDAPSDMVPLACPGVGNHLFEAASTLLQGDAGLSMELQLRTMVEMLLHKQYYLKGMIDSKIMLQAARYSLCTEESARKMNLPMAILEAIFDADVKATCYPGAFTNMWHIYALASVLQSNIYSIYPMSNLKIRPYFNRLIGPRSRSPGAPVPTFHIMWAGERLSRAVFRPQYFAPVVALGGPATSALPLKTLELMNAEPDISYSVLRERYSITKSTFYRWKRQSQEHRRRAAARYEARHFLQQCFAGGRLLPLQQFRSRFPDISRSTYYAWKHEMGVAAATSAAAAGSGPFAQAQAQDQDQDQDQARPGLPGKPAREQEQERKVPSKEAGQRSPSMQLARGFLRQCVLLNVCPPYKNFRKSYPWISRSTYYNWRREAMKQAGIRPRREEEEDEEACRHGDGLEAEPEAEGHPALVAGAGPTSVARAGPTSVARAGPTSVARAGPTSVAWNGPTRIVGARFTSVTGTQPTRIAGARPPSVAGAGPTPIAGAGPTFVAGEGPCFVDGAGPLHDKMAVPPSSPGPGRGQREQEKARRRAQRWQVPLSVFRVRFPTIPASTFLRWRALARSAGRRGARLRAAEEVPAEGVRWAVAEAEAALGPAVAVETPPSSAISKTKAKLFLQRRFISKNFPSFREFSTHFPLTPRSTYYMWKRALTNGIMLADC